MVLWKFGLVYKQRSNDLEMKAENSKFNPYPAAKMSSAIFQGTSKPFKVGENIVRVSNSLDPFALWNCYRQD